MSEVTRRRVARKRVRRARKRYHIRKRVKGTAERPRLAVHKSQRYIYAQVIDDRTGQTMAQANSLESGVRSGLDGGTCTKEAAKAVGTLLAERAMERGVKQVVFDRGGHVYHGRIQALADAAREKGLDF